MVLNTFLFFLFLGLAVCFFYLFIAGRRFTLSPLWLMLSAWMLALGVPRLHLSRLELVWPLSFWGLVLVSLVSFALGFYIFNGVFKKYPFWEKWKALNRKDFSALALRTVIYFFFLVSLVALYLFYKRAGNFPILAQDADAFRFAADDKVPGLINYCAQLARLYVPLAFFLIFWQKFNLKKHWDLILLAVVGAICLTLFASRTQIFFIDLWVMALYLLMRRPNLKQAVKFYPAFLLISIIVLAAVPLIRQYKNYGADYLVGVTEIDTSHFIKGAKYLVPIYVGVSFNMQALLHAQNYYQHHDLQHGKVTLDIFTNILRLRQFKSHYDLGAIFKPWWNTGTYLFPFVQDFGTSAFFIAPFFIAAILTLLWQYWKTSPNFLSINFYAYACFFITMSIYLSFTIRAEMYIDLFLLLMTYLIISKKSSV